MIRFIFALLFTFITVYDLALAESFDLRGNWMRTNAQEGERPVQFIQVGEIVRSYSQERYVFPDGRLSHTIAQSVKIQTAEGSVLHGTVDFYDSRGCSFKDLAVVVDIQSYNTINVLMTVPRYQVLRTECRVLEYVDVPVQLYRL